MRDFNQIAGWLLKAGGALQVQDAAQLAGAWVQLLNDIPHLKQMGRNALPYSNHTREQCIGF
jgi:3-deoxy-D-manno-octulosonic-acid transferase